MHTQPFQYLSKRTIIWQNSMADVRSFSVTSHISCSCQKFISATYLASKQCFASSTCYLFFPNTEIATIFCNINGYVLDTTLSILCLPLHMIKRRTVCIGLLSSSYSSLRCTSIQPIGLNPALLGRSIVDKQSCLSSNFNIVYRIFTGCHSVGNIPCIRRVGRSIFSR